jgi:hypothetical protein
MWNEKPNLRTAGKRVTVATRHEALPDPLNAFVYAFSALFCHCAEKQIKYLVNPAHIRYTFLSLDNCS